ncbi:MULTISPECIES: anti-sigma regulatory factor [unclassified Undibacterium]|uniref:anti-sigma regulatory factor n=1 Tax=unclassified Undibacterium TaxID=2630295 RepID=UPI002AC9C8F6|nr:MULTISPECIES: anti-sigma regulatory factor [unclassified Undibacterium]MEB0140164.1 anti-sigma regulatory factor [Undibacterium sp. CCC2.1]MEB0172462.1 anti-sigma regulatory factor [Undibacterium sp. CCC1.1]MEB0176980.1 anti-sigma regulatory factor [Undibacterium sp. CCC3.4]MEB0215584.1 anti-sigma regulatory factor [Undibacterium sp. 5I2]WPX43709.1 anti-sigma regulatory factor [Undibacterium sp. CCC3.4]
MINSCIILAIHSASDADEAVRSARQFAVALGFSTQASYQIATAAAELVSNLLEHAHGGSLEIRLLAPRPGLQLVASDSGPGIADIALAMQDGYSSKHGLGCGLPAVKRLMDEMTIESQPGKGSKIWTCKWL